MFTPSIFFAFLIVSWETSVDFVNKIYGVSASKWTLLIKASWILLAKSLGKFSKKEPCLTSFAKLYKAFGSPTSSHLLTTFTSDAFDESTPNQSCVFEWIYYTACAKS